jgi:hypothetical protein
MRFNLLKTIRDLFRGNKMSYEFVNIDVAKVEEKVKLKETATSDGKNNLPRPTSETKSNCESEAAIVYGEHRNGQIAKAVDYLNSIKGNIIDSTAKLGQQNFFIQNCENQINATLTSAEGRLSNLKSSFTTQDNEVRNFKLENNLNREPKSLTALNIFIGLIVVAILFYIELEVNSNLLAPAMTSGKKEGMAIAAAVAGLNVFVSFAIGYYGLKNFHHARSKRRNISNFFLAIYLIFITYLNWSLGAYRAIHESTGQKGLDVLKGIVETDAAVQQAQFPWTVDLTFTSLILVFVGIGFAIASLIDGYLFNDPYPGYGAVGKDRNDNRKEIDRIREHLATEIITIFKNEIRKVGETRDNIINNTLRKDWVPSVTALENTFEGYRRLANEIGEKINHIWEEYRSINSMYRTDDLTPRYWKDENDKILRKPYVMNSDKVNPEVVFRDFAALYLSKDQIEKKIEIYQNKIQDEANEFINKLNIYNEEVNKKILDIREKYNVS